MSNSNPQYQQFQDDPEHHQEIEIPVVKQEESQQKVKVDKKQKKKKAQKHKKSEDSSESDEDDDDQIKLLQKKKDTSKKQNKGSKSLQLQQMELEAANKKSLEWAIRLRSCSRIIFLIVITTLLITGFYLIFEFYAFYEGVEKVNENSNIYLNISNCRLNIFDSQINPNMPMKSSIKSLGSGTSMLHKHRMNIDHDGLTNKTKVDDSLNETIQIIPNIMMTYTIPGRFNVDPQANTSEVSQDKNGSNYTYTFKNILSAQSCEIDIHVYKMTAINNMIIHCFDTCYMMIGATNITFNNFNISGDLVEVNAPYLVSKNFSYQSIQGRFQGGFLDFEQYADIRLDSGDIIVQTDKEMMVNWTHSNPHYCYGSPVIANPIVVGCQQAPQSEIDAFISGVGTGKKDKTKVKKDSNETKKGDEKPKTDEPKKDDGSEDTEDTEYFYEQGDAGTVILLPFMDTYQESKNFKNDLGFLQELEESQEKNKTNSTTNTNTTSKPNMHSKTKEKKVKLQLLFQPSCFGNSIFCQTPNCTTIKDALSKNNETISVSNSTGETPEDTKNTTRRRFLSGEPVENKTTNGNSTNSTKTNETKIDYKGLNQEAYKKLPHIIPKGIRFLNVTGRFGNIYVNVIEKPNSTVGMKDTIIHGMSYASGNVEFDLPSQKTLKTYFEMAADPHNFDPNFVLEIGSKMTKSDNFQQWQITYNPAYSYIRPWWIGTFSFTLMSTASWDLKLNLGPGYCPYLPDLNLNDIYSASFLIEKYFKQAEHSITTIAWQDSVPFPGADYSTESNGVRQVINSNDEFERWVQIAKLNETTYDLTTINLNQSQATLWAVYVSLLISVLMAAMLIIGVLYMINSVYKQIIEQVTSTNKYGSIEKKNDLGGEQPLMKKAPEHNTQKNPKDKKKTDTKGDDKKKEKVKKKETNDEFEIVLNFNPARLFYQLFVLAPPLSAFIDYLCVLVTKKYINSANEFYTHLFEKKEKSNGDQELHDLTTESILGNEMKTLYEKFCFLNGFLEQKLDDEDNLKLLKTKGFKVEEKQDAQTESYVRVLLTGMIIKLSQITKEKTPLALFIENCCKTSNFEEDNIVVATFNENFQEFCTLNHLEFEAPSAAELQKNYNIESKYIPQQWVERDETELPKHQEGEELSMQQKVTDCVNGCVQKCMPDKETFIINRQKMQNHYSLIMNQPEKIKTQAELALANRELILFGGWWLVDFITVWAHLITTIILILPLFGFTLLEKILYAQYSLIPGQYLITLEDILANYWLLPVKLYNESTWIKNILILVAIYWIYSITDLIYYYISMEFPQENFFKKVQPRTANKIQLIFRQVMWALVIYSAYQLCVFLTLALVWLLLGAIVNPTAFLPYATAAATFVAVVSTKATQFQEIASDGFATVIEYIENIAKGQMGNMLSKMDLKGKAHAVMDSGAFKSIAGQAASLGLVDQNTLTHLEENADSMLSNPEKALENAAGELQEIASNPGAFVAKLMKQLEEKAISMIREQMAKQIDGFGEQLANIALALFKKDKNQFKNNMAQLMYAAAKAQKLDSLMKMGQPIMNFVWEFAYPAESNAKLSPEDYLEQLLGPCTDCISGLVAQEIQTISKDLEFFDSKVLQIILRKAISLEKNLQKENLQGIFNDLEEIIQSLKDEPQFTQIKYLSRYAGLLKIAMSLFEGRKGGELTFHKIFGIISGFFDEIPQLKKLKDLLGMIELLVNSFKKQSKALPTKIIRQRIQKGLNVVQAFAKEKQIKFRGADRILENVSFVTLMFNFMQHNFEKIPKEQLKDVFRYSFEQAHDCSEIAELVKSEKEYKKLIKLMTGIFEMVSLFMEETKELTTNLHQAAAAFAIDEKKADYIQTVSSIKYLKHTTYEGSEAEDKLFESLSTNPLILNLTIQLRVDAHIIRGIIAQLMSYPNRQGLQDLYLVIAKLNKSELVKVRLFFQILTLFRSNNESHLSNAAVNLSIPREYIVLILISKQVLDPNYIDEESLITLGAQEETIKMLKNVDFDRKLWVQQLKKDITEEDDGLVQGGNSIQLKLFLLEAISDSNFQITAQKVQGLLMALGNNSNEFAKLSQNDIDLLTNILNLKNIDLMNSNALSSDTKQGIYTFAHILNLNKTYFEDLINIVFLTNSDRVVQSIQNSQQQEKPFIEANAVKDYEDYMEFLFSKMDLIQKKHNFLIDKFSTMFPMIKLPRALIQKLLFNKEQSMDINSFYQLAYLIIDKDESGKLPKGTLRQLNKSVAFLTSTLNSHDVDGLRQSLQKQDLTDGQGVIIQMLNENSRKRALTLFLNFLYDNSKKNKNDDQRPLPQVFHLFACLYLHFTGQSQDLLIKYIDPISKIEKDITILQFLTKKLDIKSEFFEALHTFYLQDNQKFTSIMVKFMRRQQACKFEQENPGIKIPLQSLVKIPDQFVLNFINLITGTGYQTSFFSKELGLDADIVLLISTLMNIQNASNANERKTECSYLANNSQKIGPLLSQVQVFGDELILLLNLAFQDYDTSKLQYIIDGLKLQQKLKVSYLGAILQVDQVISQDLNSLEYFNQLQLQIKENQLISNMKIDPELVMMAKGLIRGGFGCMDQYIKILPHLDYPECPGKQEYFGLLQGIVGSISGVIPQEFNIRLFLSDLYKSLSDNSIKVNPSFQNGTNSIQYAYFQLAKTIQINPIILMLTQGVLPAWKLLDANYYTIQNEENKWIHPILVSQLILTFQALPTLIKEIFTEVEWFQQTSQIIGEAEDLQNRDQAPYNLVDFLNYSDFDPVVELAKDLRQQLFAEQLDSAQSFQDFAQMISFDTKVIDFLALTDEDIHEAQSAILADSVELYGSEEPDYQDDCNEIAKLIRETPSSDPAQTTISFDDAVDLYRLDPDQRIFFKSLKPQIQYRAMLKIYQETTKLFVDPRFEDQSTIPVFSEQYFMSKLPYEEIGIFNLGVCSTLNQLRQAYWNAGENIVPRDDDHYKVVAGQVDFVLTSIDRLFHFKNCMDFFSKQRASTLIGLATGFAFTADNFIQANCTSSLVTYERANQLTEMMQNQQDLQKRKNQFKWEYISNQMYYRDYNAERDRKFFKMYKTNAIKKHDLDIYTEPENYIECAIQAQATLQDDQKGYNWIDYFFDNGYVSKGSSMDALARYEDQENEHNGIRLSDREKMIHKWINDNCQYQIEAQFEKAKKEWDQAQQLQPIKLQAQQSTKEPQPQKASMENIYDVRSGKKWSEAYASQQKWQTLCYQQTDYFKLLIDIFKGNYSAICEPDTYFTDEEPQAAMAYSGIVAISGSFYKVRNGWNQNTPNDLSKYLNSCCWNTQSNKKNLQELLSIFFQCFEGLNVLSQTLMQDSSLVNSFICLSCKLSNNDQEQYDHLGTLINAMNLSENDAEVLQSLIRAYLGEVDEYYQLAQFSTLIQPPKSDKFKPVQMSNLIKKKRGGKQEIKQEDIPTQPELGQQLQKQSSNVSQQQQQQQQEEQQQKEQQIQNQNQDQDQKGKEPSPLLKKEMTVKDEVKDNKKGKDDKKGKEAKKGMKIKKKKGTSVESSNLGDLYFSVPKILNKLLYGLDQSQLHKLEKIDPSRFNFCNYSALALDSDKTEDQFIILLWQLAQAATKETLPENCKLPVMSESELASGNQNAKEFKQNYGFVWPCCQFMVQIINDDYSFFFKNKEVSRGILTKFSVLRQDYADEDLNFLKAMIGLKSNKMQVIQNKVLKNKGSKTKQEDISGLDIQEQVDNLFDSKIIHIQVEGQSEESNTKISKNIAQLFLAISSGNINKIVESLMDRDSMSACFVLTLFLWKNLTPILSKPNILKNQQTQLGVLPALQLLPLLIFSSINDQQDKQKGQPRKNQMNKILGAMRRIIELIQVNKPSQEFYDELEQIQLKQRKQKKSFQWSLWIITIPQFLIIFRSFAREQKLQAYGETEYLFKLLTGYYFYEKIQSTKFIGPIMQLYVQCNKLINYPQLLCDQKLNLKTMIPVTMNSLMDFLPEDLKTYIQVFDKFVQLFVFIQIPPSSMKLLKKYSQKDVANSQNLQEDEEPEEDENQEQQQNQSVDQIKQQEGNEQNADDSTSAQIEQIITEFILDVLGQTVNGLWSSFKEENRRDLYQKIEALTKEITDNKNKMKLMQNQPQQAPIFRPSVLGMQPQPIQSQQQLMGQQLMGQSQQPMMGQQQPIMMGQTMQQPMMGQQQQQPMMGQTIMQQPNQQSTIFQQMGQTMSNAMGGVMSNALGIPQAPPLQQMFDFITKEKDLEKLRKDLKQIDDSSLQVKKLIQGIIILLTGYNIDDKSATVTKELKVTILCYIVDSTLFKNLGLLKYLNTSVIRDLYKDIHDITNQPFKSITNPDFMTSILQLIYTVTGQEPSDEIKDKKSKILVIKQEKKTNKANTWHVELPQRVLIVELPVNIIQSIFKLATGKVEAISLLLKELKVGEGVIKIVDNIIKQVNEMGVFGGKPPAIGQSGANSKKGQEIQELMKKIQEGTASSEDMFKAIDEDGTNSISKQEYGILAKRLGMNLSEHRINEIFANIKKGSAKDDSLNQKEFAKAMTYLQQKNTDMALDFLGISPALLTISLIMLAIILLLIFVFIFLGIQAFALGGTFGAVVNSMLPMAAGGGAGNKAEKLGDKGKKDTSIGDSVEKTQKIIQSDKI